MHPQNPSNTAFEEGNHVVSVGIQDNTNLPSFSSAVCSSQKGTCDQEILVQNVHLVPEDRDKGQRIIDY